MAMEAESELETDMSVCAVDADSMGHSEVQAALTYLQAEGLKVILVSRRDLSNLCDSGGIAESIDAGNLFVVNTCNETSIELLRIAQDYGCMFMTNSDVESLKEDWRLPWKVKEWMHSALPELHARFIFSPQGAFKVMLPPKVVQHLRKSRQEKAAAAAEEAVPAAAAPFMATVPAGTTVPWAVLGACPLVPAAPPLPPGPPPPAAAAAAPAAPAAPPPPPPPPQEGVPKRSSALSWLEPMRDSSDNALKVVHTQHHFGTGVSSAVDDMELQPPPSGWLSEGGFPPMAVLPLPGGPSLLCLMCEAKSEWLFPYACELSANEAGSGGVDETNCGELYAHLKVLGSASAHWGYTACISRCSGGKHHGMQAVGFGANNITRKRAGRVALAVTMRVNAKEGIIQDPSGDGLYAKLASHAERLLLSGTDSRDLSLRELTRLLPPPPPGAPRYASTQCYPSLEPRRWPGQEQLQDGISHEGLHGRLATATAAYSGESAGYLPLRPGDCMVLECNECAPGDEHCRYKNYLYGKRLQGPSTYDGFAPSSGWFPFNLVHLD